jgi:hypothetical protein
MTVKPLAPGVVQPLAAASGEIVGDSPHIVSRTGWRPDCPFRSNYRTRCHLLEYRCPNLHVWLSVREPKVNEFPRFHC